MKMPAHAAFFAKRKDLINSGCHSYI